MSVNAIILKILAIGYAHCLSVGDMYGAINKRDSMRAVASKIIGATC